MTQRLKEVILASLFLFPPLVMTMLLFGLMNFYGDFDPITGFFIFVIIYFFITSYLLLATRYSKKLSLYLGFLTTPGQNQITLEKRKDVQKNYILENISEGICAVNAEGNIIFYNQKFYKKFIKPWKISSHQNLSVDVIFQNHEDLKQAFHRVYRLQNNETIRQVKHHHKGRDLYFDVTISSAIKDVDNFTSAIGVFHDVTEKRLTELMRANFVANISHEIRTPLTSILGFTEVLENKMEQQHVIEVATLKPFLKPIIHNAHKLKKLFSDLLTLSLIESERKIFKSTTSLQELFDQQIHFLSANYPQKEIHVTKKILHDNLYVDRELFQQVLSNLIDNSLKYSLGTLVEICLEATLEPDLQKVLITISDNNPALPDFELERIFERFYRLDSARSANQGSGIGLSIVKQIMTKHSGRAFAKNEGGKTYFCLSLPVPKTL